MYSIKEKMYELIYGQMNKWVDGLIDGWMNRWWLDMKQQIDGLIELKNIGLMDWSTDGWVDGRIKRSVDENDE